jgi:hypothetical protein
VLDPANVPPLEAGEILARYILASSHFRRSDNSVKPGVYTSPTHRIVAHPTLPSDGGGVVE